MPVHRPAHKPHKDQGADETPQPTEAENQFEADRVGQVAAGQGTDDRAGENGGLIEGHGSRPLLVRGQFQEQVEIGQIITGPE